MRRPITTAVKVDLAWESMVELIPSMKYITLFMRTKKSQRVHGSSAPPQGTRPLAREQDRWLKPKKVLIEQREKLLELFFSC